MTDTKKYFHLLSYIQYPILLVVTYYYGLFIFSIAKLNPDWNQLNNALIYLGIQIGFSTLQDTNKTQNNFSKRIWENPKKGNIAIFCILFMVAFFLIFGLVGFFKSQENIHKEISFGLIILGISLIGLLKAAIEMFENHRKDKNPSSSNV